MYIFLEGQRLLDFFRNQNSLTEEFKSFHLEDATQWNIHLL